MDRFKCYYNIIGYIQVDCFGSQVWERKFPILKDSCYIVADASGKVVAVSPEAKKRGVSALQTLKEVELVCPNINVVFKPEGMIEDKKCSWEVREAIAKFCEARKIPFQYFKPDECFLDLTKSVQYQIGQNSAGQKSRDLFPPCFEECVNIYLEHEEQFRHGEIANLLNRITQNLTEETFLKLEDSITFKLKAGDRDGEYYSWNSISVEDGFLLKLLFGASMVNSIITDLENWTGIKCSASVSSNMLLAKLACNFHPQGRTLSLLTAEGMKRISPYISVFSLPEVNEECKFKLLNNFGCNNFQQLAFIPLSSLKTAFSHEVALKIYQSSKGICNSVVNPNPVLQDISFANYKLCVTTNKELRTQLELLLVCMLKKLEEELETHKRGTRSLKVTFSCSSVDGKENSVAEVEVDYFAERHESLLHIAQRLYREICKKRGFDSKFTTITSLEISHRKFFSVLNVAGRNVFNNLSPRASFVVNQRRYTYNYDRSRQRRR